MGDLTVYKKLEILSSMVNRANLFSKLGNQTFGGERDVYEALGYPRILKYDDYWTQYSRQDIAQAIIDRPANATWKGDLRLLVSEIADDTSFEKKWIDLDKSLKLKTTFKRLDKLTCLGEYAILLFGFDDISKIEDFKKPVKSGKRKLLYIKPYSKGAVKISTWDKNSFSSRYGLPVTYEVMITEPSEEGLHSGMESSTGQTILVHHTRVLHVIYSQLDSEVEGTPVLKSVYNRLLDLEKLTGGSAEMFWRGARPGYQGVVDSDFQLTPEMENDLKDQLDEFEHNMRRFLINEGVEMKSLEPQVSDPKNHVDIQIQMISAVTGIPKRILTGSERGEMSSAQDDDTWQTLIQARREDFAEPSIIRPFVDVCIKHGILPDPGKPWIVNWTDLFTKSDKDLAEIGRIRSTAVKEYTTNPLAEDLFPPEAFFQYGAGLRTDEITHVMELRKKAQKEDENNGETAEERAIRLEQERQNVSGSRNSDE